MKRVILLVVSMVAIGCAGESPTNLGGMDPALGFTLNDRQATSLMDRLVDSIAATGDQRAVAEREWRRAVVSELDPSASPFAQIETNPRFASVGGGGSTGGPSPLTAEGEPNLSVYALIQSHGGTTVATDANLETGTFGGIMADSWMSFYGNSWYLDIQMTASSNGQGLGTFSSIPNEDRVGLVFASRLNTRANGKKQPLLNALCTLQVQTNRNYQARWELDFNTGYYPVGYKWGRKDLTTYKSGSWDLGGFAPNCAPPSTEPVAEDGGGGGGGGGGTLVCVRVISGYIDLEWDQIVIEMDTEYCYTIGEYAELRSAAATAIPTKQTILATAVGAQAYPVEIRVGCAAEEPDKLVVNESVATAVDIANALEALRGHRSKGYPCDKTERRLVVSSITLSSELRMAQLARARTLAEQLAKADERDVRGVGRTRAISIVP